MAQVVQAVVTSGFWPALGRVFDISVVTVAGTAMGVRLAWTSRQEAADRFDVVLAGLMGLLVLLPHRAGSWAAVVMLGGWLWWRSRPGDALAPAGVVLALVGASAFWCGVVAQLFASPALSWDAALGAGVLRLFGGVAAQGGNLILVDGQEPLVVLAGCSSLLIAGYAVSCWATVTYGRRPMCCWADLAGAAAVTAIAVLANAGRLALMSLNEDAYQWVHSPVGAGAFNVGVLSCAVVLAVATASVAHPRR